MCFSSLETRPVIKDPKPDSNVNSSSLGSLRPIEPIEHFISFDTGECFSRGH